MDRASDNAMHQHRHEAGEYRRIEVITGVARLRRWTADHNAAMVAESLQPGINISELARRCGVHRGGALASVTVNLTGDYLWDADASAGPDGFRDRPEPGGAIGRALSRRVRRAG